MMKFYKTVFLKHPYFSYYCFRQRGFSPKLQAGANVTHLRVINPQRMEE